MYDISLHLAVEARLDFIDSFADVPVALYARIIDHHSVALRSAGFRSGHLWCADKRWITDSDKVTALTTLAQGAGFHLSACLDPTDVSGPFLAASAGFDGVVLSPIHAGFGTADIMGTTAWKAFCHNLGEVALPVFMTTAYGTENLYRYDSLMVLAGLLAEQVGAAPVVALHGGGHRFVELVLLAEAFPNLMIDLSFSLLYYRESNVETDWIWGMKRLGETRFVFGSDEPFASRVDSLDLFKDLMQAAGWSPAAQELALCENAKRVFSQRPLKVGREL